MTVVTAQDGLAARDANFTPMDLAEVVAESLVSDANVADAGTAAE